MPLICIETLTDIILSGIVFFFFDHEPRFTTSAIMVSGMNPIAAKNFQHYPPGSSRLRALKLAGRFTQTEVFFVLQTRSYCVETRDNKGMGVVV